MRSARALGPSVVLAALALACPSPEVDAPPPAQPPPALTFDRLLNPAQMEEHFPLTDEMLAGVTPESLTELPQWQIDQLYARLNAGPLPTGEWQGAFFFADGLGPQSFSGGVDDLDLVLLAEPDELARLGDSLWRDKTFDAEDGSVRTRIETDRGQITLVHAALACGDSLHDARKPSIIVDYATSAATSNEDDPFSQLVSPAGLEIRDEMRLVRPGLYLGIAYARQRPLLVFTLAGEAVEGEGDSDTPC